MLYVCGLILFFAVHFLPILGLQPHLTEKFGEPSYKGGFALVSLVGLLLIVFGWNSFPNVYFYQPPMMLKHLNLLLMVFAFIFLTAAYVPNNLRRRVRNPMLTGVKIWAVGHLLANGDLRSALLFSTFLVFSIIDVVSLKKRGKFEPKPPVSPLLDAAMVLVALAGYFLVFKYHGDLFGMPIVLKVNP